ncbi:gas vesicle protein GvpO [Pseudonocardia sp. H11422]|uniref:gas vesicle protein GvpO n=1 Tax=Pseudonocardia sp. H11422 TaxID=2835866 RepID=UPI0027E2EDE9|nr:gas vesicle protein GvpO [Pseudonocardia sp. H11422]
MTGDDRDDEHDRRAEPPRRRRRPREDRPDPDDRDDDLPGRNGRIRSAGVAARRAAREVADLTGRTPEGIVSIQRSEDGWVVGIEVVETRRIPDSADILATYEAELDAHGELVSYRRTRRYSRGRLREE